MSAPRTVALTTVAASLISEIHSMADLRVTLPGFPLNWCAGLFLVFGTPSYTIIMRSSWSFWVCVDSKIAAS